MPLHLATVTCPSGHLVVLDGARAAAWSHDRPPQGVVDLRITGPEAEEAARAFDRAADPRFVWDVLPEAVDATRAAFDALRYDAALAPIQPVPHRDRALLVSEPGAGELSFDGSLAVAIRGIPAGPLALLAEPMPPGPDARRWRAVWLDCGNGPVARTERVGFVLVGGGRLLVADLEALGHWNRALADGRVEVAFWGRDAEEAARRLGAGPIGAPEDGRFGWEDLPEAAAARCASALAELRGALRFAVEVRPHDDEWRLLRRTRASPYGGAAIEVAGASVAGCFTTWGDGAFPVEVDRDAAGRVVRVRIDLGNEQIVARQRAFEDDWLGEGTKLAIVSRRALERFAGLVYREPPDHDRDSGWRVLHGDESAAFLGDPANAVALPVREVRERTGTPRELWTIPAPCAFARRRAEDGWTRIEAEEPPN